MLMTLTEGRALSLESGHQTLCFAHVGAKASVGSRHTWEFSAFLCFIMADILSDRNSREALRTETMWNDEV